jgi:ABC-type uncharacterized transport system substrate-binding protein
VRRREFFCVFGSVAAWPLAVEAQQVERVRRIGVLMNLAADDAEGKARLTAFIQGLHQFGWADGRNVRIDTHWHADDADRMRRFVAELVPLTLDAILVTGSPAVAALHHASRTVPIVFVAVVDPVGAGFFESLGRPGGNITGLKQIAPGVTRAAVLRDPDVGAGTGQFAVIQAVAPSAGM